MHGQYGFRNVLNLKCFANFFKTTLYFWIYELNFKFDFYFMTILQY